MKEGMFQKRSGIFLIEIIIAILLFALVSAVCLKLFVHSKQLSQESKYLNASVSASVTVSEIFDSQKSAAAAVKKTEKIFGKSITEKSSKGAILIQDKRAPLYLKVKVAPAEKNGIRKIYIRTFMPDTANPGKNKTIYKLCREVYYEEK